MLTVQYVQADDDSYVRIDVIEPELLDRENHNRLVRSRLDCS